MTILLIVLMLLLKVWKTRRLEYCVLCYKSAMPKFTIVSNFRRLNRGLAEHPSQGLKIAEAPILRDEQKALIKLGLSTTSRAKKLI